MGSALVSCSLLPLVLINCFQPAIAQSRPSAIAPSAAPPKELRYDVGTIANGLYSNGCFGFSIAIPSVWNVPDSLGNSQSRYGGGSDRRR